MSDYSVQRLRGGFALVWREEGRRKRRQLASEDRQSAEAEARQLWEAGDDSSPWTVGRIMSGYLTSIEAKTSHGRRQDAWKAMRGFWQDVAPSLIDERMAQDYAKQRRASDSTARYELMQVSTALNWAVGQGHLVSRRPIWLPQLPERKERHLTRSEFARFFAEVKADHARLYVMLGIYTMARSTIFASTRPNLIAGADRPRTKASGFITAWINENILLKKGGSRHERPIQHIRRTS